MKLRAIIVDDEPIARDRLRRLLAEHPQVEIVGEHGDGKSAIAGYAKKNRTCSFSIFRCPA